MMLREVAGKLPKSHPKCCLGSLQFEQLLWKPEQLLGQLELQLWQLKLLLGQLHQLLWQLGDQLLSFCLWIDGLVHVVIHYVLGSSQCGVCSRYDSS